MKTVQIMQRQFFDSIIKQRTSDSFFLATDLLQFYNESHETKKVLPEFWSNKNTQEFINELENDINQNIGNSLYLKCYETSRGKGGGTWMHPYLFVKFAMWLSPRFELLIIKWVYDNLIDFRISAGDNYKIMCKAIQENIQEGTSDPMIFAKEATYLNLLVFGSSEKDKRNSLNEKELKLLNELQLLNKSYWEQKLPEKKRKELLKNHCVNFKIIYK